LILDGNNEFIENIPSDWNDKIISFMKTKTPVPEYQTSKWEELVAF
jgi:hypothetical protein